MADFDYVAWGNANVVGKWTLETGESGVYRGQCTQVVSQLLKDLGVADYAAARGNGNQVGPNMVIRGEATYEGTNLTSIPENEIHIICKDVGNISTAGHVSVCAIIDIIFEQNVYFPGAPTHNYGIGPTYPGRLGRLSESWRGTRYHYKLIAPTDYDNVGGTDGGEPGDDGIGPNQNRYLRSKVIVTKKRKTSKNHHIKNHKRYYAISKTVRGIAQN
jgi:hypothetical protein